LFNWLLKEERTCAYTAYVLKLGRFWLPLLYINWNPDVHPFMVRPSRFRDGISPEDLPLRLCAFAGEVFVRCSTRARSFVY
jgi:hypothetical protein